MIGGIRTSLGVSDDPMFLWISSNSCPLNLLLVRSHQAEIIIVKRLIQGRNNVTRVRVEPRPFDQGRRKNDAFTHSATLLLSIVKRDIKKKKHEVNFILENFPAFGFLLENQELNKKWITFLNRKDWTPTQHGGICSKHFEVTRG